jgi:hypothetical protein
MRRVNIEHPIYFMAIPAAADAWLLLCGTNHLKARQQGNKATRQQGNKATRQQGNKATRQQNVV